MELRRLGTSGIEVTAVGLGCWAAGGPFRVGDAPLGWGARDPADTVLALRAAIDLGVTLFDTADVYGCGRSEKLLGEAVAGCRDEVVLATKFGNVFDDEGIVGLDASPKYIRSACEASLRRLGTDRIDLYQLHGDSWPIDALEPIVATLAELVDVGKIRAFGWSTNDAERARAFAALGRCSAVQHDCNVLEDAPAMLALCDQLHLASLARTPLC